MALERSQFTLQVSTSELSSASSEIYSLVHQISNELSEMKRNVDATGSFWEGEGAEMCRNAFADFQEGIALMTSRLGEHVTDLNQIAGIYEQAEQQAAEAAEVLDGDVII